MERRRSIALGCSGALVVAVVLGLLANEFVSRRLASRGEVIAREMASLGYPATVEELAAYQNGPFDGPNGWDDFEAALALFTASGTATVVPDLVERLRNLESGAALSPEDSAEVERVLAANAASIDAVRRAVDGEVFRQPIERSTDPEAAIMAMLWSPRGVGTDGSFDGLLWVFDILALNAGVNGDEATAVEAIRLRLRLGERLDDQPGDRAMAFSDNLRTGAAELSRELIEVSFRKDPAALERLAELLEGSEPGDVGRMTWTMVLLLEELYGVLLSGDLIRDELANNPFNSPSTAASFVTGAAWITAYRHSYLGDNDRLRAREMAARAAEISDGPLGEMIRELQTRQEDRSLIASLYILSGGSFDLAQPLTREADLRGRLRTAAAAARVMAWRAERGRLPTVEEFAREIPALPDPYDGERLRYVVMESGFRVHTVGENGIDEGGEWGPGPLLDHGRAQPFDDVGTEILIRE